MEINWEKVAEDHGLSVREFDKKFSEAIKNTY